MLSEPRLTLVNGVFLVSLGSVLVYMGASGDTDFPFSWLGISLGIAAIFLGAALIVRIRNTLEYHPLLEAKPLNKFGGWLRFLQVFSIWRIIFLIMEFARVMLGNLEWNEQELVVLTLFYMGRTVLLVLTVLIINLGPMSANSVNIAPSNRRITEWRRTRE